MIFEERKTCANCENLFYTIYIKNNLKNFNIGALHWVGFLHSWFWTRVKSSTLFFICF